MSADALSEDDGEDWEGDGYYVSPVEMTTPADRIFPPIRARNVAPGHFARSNCFLFGHRGFLKQM